MKEAINGIFSDTLKSVAHWFLYIFIDVNANMGSAIMTKRKNQIWWLHKLDDINGYYNFTQLVDIVKQGIEEMYHKTPAEVLQQMYNVAMATSTPISGIGKLVPGTDIEYSDPSLMNPITLQPYKSVSEISLTTYDKSGTVVKKQSTFWKDCASVIEWIVNLVKSLGYGNTNGITSTTPSSTDWSKLTSDTTTSAGLGASLPFVIGGVIIYYLFTNSQTKTN